MIDLTLTQLIVCTGASKARAAPLLDGIKKAIRVYGIDERRERVGMLLANVGHETMGLLYLKELGGPKYFAKYNGRTDLGNGPTDGPRYPGRGLLQTTGRANYAKLRDRLRARGVACPDFESEPQTLELPEWAALSACDYVDMRKLNAKADADDFLGYCVGVNGRNSKTGLPNGWDDRKHLWKAAQEVL